MGVRVRSQTASCLLACCPLMSSLSCYLSLQQANLAAKRSIAAALLIHNQMPGISAT